MNKHSLLFYLRVGLSLMLIAAAVGALLAVVHAVTADRIAEQEEAK